MLLDWRPIQSRGRRTEIEKLLTMTVGKKLMICIAAMLTVVLGLAAAGWYSNRNLSKELNFATETVATRAIFAGELRAEVVTLREKQRGVLMYAFGREAKKVEQNRAEF